MGADPAPAHQRAAMGHRRRSRPVRCSPRTAARRRYRDRAGLRTLALRVARGAPLPREPGLLALARHVPAPQPPHRPGRDRRPRRPRGTSPAPQPERRRTTPHPTEPVDRPVGEAGRTGCWGAMRGPRPRAGCASTVDTVLRAAALPPGYREPALRRTVDLLLGPGIRVDGAWIWDVGSLVPWGRAARVEVVPLVEIVEESGLGGLPR